MMVVVFVEVWLDTEEVEVVDVVTGVLFEVNALVVVKYELLWEFEEIELDTDVANLEAIDGNVSDVSSLFKWFKADIDVAWDNDGLLLLTVLLKLVVFR